ncbi:hypothetical protein CHS0354_031249 [Potamilus streckersoni]|uniref:Uncharacterized protein n=1 Tax=Potamilus streckersoni TaxID=2493646 RepID=A0AAE0SC47_9BIVA|nr:hypothetical protein CHS0354_031249 [Potamilus streckersoni]
MEMPRDVALLVKSGAFGHDNTINDLNTDSFCARSTTVRYKENLESNFKHLSHVYTIIICQYVYANIICVRHQTMDQRSYVCPFPIVVLMINELLKFHGEKTQRLQTHHLCDPLDRDDFVTPTGNKNRRRQRFIITEVNQPFLFPQPNYNLSPFED